MSNNIVEVNDVSLKFNIDANRPATLKEFVVRWIKRVGANYTIKTKKCNISVMEDKDSKRSKQAVDLLAQKKAEFKIINLEELQKITNSEEVL